MAQGPRPKKNWLCSQETIVVSRCFVHISNLLETLTNHSNVTSVVVWEIREELLPQVVASRPKFYHESPGRASYPFELLLLLFLLLLLSLLLFQIIIINLKDSPTESFSYRGVSISPQFHKVRKQLKRDREERRKGKRQRR